MIQYDPHYDPSTPAGTQALEPVQQSVDPAAGVSTTHGEDAEHPENRELTPQEQAAMDAAVKLRDEGGSRAESISLLIDGGYEEERAAAVIDALDKMHGIVRGTRAGDVSDKVAKFLDEIEAKTPPEERSRPLTKKPEVLMKEATKLAARGRTKKDVAASLTKHGVSQAEADKVATRICMDVAAAKASFNESKKKATNSAYLRIGLGAVLLVVGLALMGSDTDTGRRSPLGVVLAAGFMIASGVKQLMDVQEQTFQQRVNEVYR